MKYDLILVGGGLSSGLIAWNLHVHRPDVTFLILEREGVLGGNHTWSFHPSDVGLHSQHWLSDLISKSWDKHCVRFPKYSRELYSGYCSIRSSDFNWKLSERFGDRIRLNANVAAIHSRCVTLESGESIEAEVVLDGRGRYVCKKGDGYQKFVGQFVRTIAPHGQGCPILMDATVDQVDGYRFMYVLPWDDTHLLVEDTYYSESPTLPVHEIEGRIAKYCVSHGWVIDRITHQETGVLPIPTRLPDVGEAVGLSGGLFNPTTGFSLPDAVRMAEWVVRYPGDWRSLPSELMQWTSAHRKRARFFLRLNQMLFWAVGASERYRVLQRFYRLPESTILRFYRGELSFRDRARILIGRPPVPLLTMASHLWERSKNATLEG